MVGKEAVGEAILKLAGIIGGLDLKDGPWLAGGAARALLSEEEVKDFDLFFASQEQADAVETALVSAGATMLPDQGPNKSVGSDWGDEAEDRPVVSRNYVVEGVGVVNVARTYVFPNLASLFGSFDFSVCKVAVVMGWEPAIRMEPGSHGLFMTLIRSKLCVFVASEGVKRDVETRTLRVDRETSARRIKRYLKKGFHLTGSQLHDWEHCDLGPIPGLVVACCFSRLVGPPGGAPMIETGPDLEF